MNNTQDCTGGVVLHPCCIGLLGECIITTKENCSFQEGYWHPSKVCLYVCVHMCCPLMVSQKTDCKKWFRTVWMEGKETIVLNSINYPAGYLSLF